MSAMPKPEPTTEAEYLALEIASEHRHEFIDGEIRAMVGASEPHSAIASSLSFLLYSGLRDKPCRVYQGDMRVRISAAGNYVYPDLVVVCGEAQFQEDEGSATLLNPTLIVEVLSPSTEAVDRGSKFHNYQMLPSVQDYVLVAQATPRLECFSRGASGTWVLTPAEGLDAAMTLPSVGLTLALAEVYEQVEFTPSQSDEAGSR